MNAWLLLAALACAREEEGRAALIRPGGMVLYYGASGPLAFEAMTPRDLPADAVLVPEVRGRSCQNALAVPLGLSPRSSTISAAFGDGGYQRALADLARRHQGLRGIYDVKVDLHMRSVLGLFRRLCTEVSARGFR